MAVNDPVAAAHDHVFLGDDHRRNERKVWLVIAVTAVMMVVEITAGTVYGSMALVADGWHMSTHAGAMLITAFAYGYARRHLRDPRFTFGTGKLGDLAGFTSAVVLALIALLIGWESFLRFVRPVPIGFEQAITVAIVGLAVNLVCAWLLKDDHAGHRHGHPGHRHHDHDHDHGPSLRGHDDHDHPIGPESGSSRGLDHDDRGHGSPICICGRSARATTARSSRWLQRNRGSRHTTKRGSPTSASFRT